MISRGDWRGKKKKASAIDKVVGCTSKATGAASFRPFSCLSHFTPPRSGHLDSSPPDRQRWGLDLRCGATASAQSSLRGHTRVRRGSKRGTLAFRMHAQLGCRACERACVRACVLAAGLCILSRGSRGSWQSSAPSASSPHFGWPSASRLLPLRLCPTRAVLRPRVQSRSEKIPCPHAQ